MGLLELLGFREKLSLDDCGAELYDLTTQVNVELEKQSYDGLSQAVGLLSQLHGKAKRTDDSELRQYSSAALTHAEQAKQQFGKVIAGSRGYAPGFVPWHLQDQQANLQRQIGAVYQNWLGLDEMLSKYKDE